MKLSARIKKKQTERQRAKKTLFIRLAEWLTKHSRDKISPVVDFTWSNKSVIYNVYRLYEMIFGRSHGIRLEAYTSVVRDKGRVKVVRQFYTVESLLVHLECALYDRVRNLRLPRVKIEVCIPALSVSGFPIQNLGTGVLFAIAFDAASSADLGTTGTSLTFSHTCTGSNLTLTCGSAIGNSTSSGNGTSSITYNSVGLTSAASVGLNNDNRFNDSLWYLANPAIGANNVVITSLLSSSTITGGAISLSGTAVSPAGNTATNFGNSSTPSVSITTGTANSWVVNAIVLNNTVAGANPSATGTNQTSRYQQTEAAGGRAICGSTQTTTTTGSYTSSWSINITAWGSVALEIKPSTSTAWTQTCSETLTDTDTVAKSTNRSLSETLTDTDTQRGVKIKNQTLSEAQATLDTLSRLTSRTLSETLTDTDTLTELIGRTLVETITDTDSLMHLPSRNLTDNVSYTDTLIKIFTVHTFWTQESRQATTWTQESRQSSIWTQESRPVRN